MKVRDLIAKLGQLDQDLEVLCSTDCLNVMDIEAVTATEGTVQRGSADARTFLVGKGVQSMPLALIEVTSDF